MMNTPACRSPVAAEGGAGYREFTMIGDTSAGTCRLTAGDGCLLQSQVAAVLNVQHLVVIIAVNAVPLTLNGNGGSDIRQGGGKADIGLKNDDVVPGTVGTAVSACVIVIGRRDGIGQGADAAGVYGDIADGRVDIDRALVVVVPHSPDQGRVAGHGHAVVEVQITPDPGQAGQPGLLALGSVPGPAEDIGQVAGGHVVVAVIVLRDQGRVAGHGYRHAEPVIRSPVRGQQFLHIVQGDISLGQACRKQYNQEKYVPQSCLHGVLLGVKYYAAAGDRAAARLSIRSEVNHFRVKKTWRFEDFPHFGSCVGLIEGKMAGERALKSDLVAVEQFLPDFLPHRQHERLGQPLIVIGIPGRDPFGQLVIADDGSGDVPGPVGLRGGQGIGFRSPLDGRHGYSSGLRLIDRQSY